MTRTRFGSSGVKKEAPDTGASFSFQEEMFSAGGPRKQAPDVMRVRTGRKGAKTKS